MAVWAQSVYYKCFYNKQTYTELKKNIKTCFIDNKNRFLTTMNDTSTRGLPATAELLVRGNAVCVFSIAFL